MKCLKEVDKLDELTFEADMLLQVMDDALRFHENNDEIIAISHLSAIIRKKFRKIRSFFW